MYGGCFPSEYTVSGNYSRINYNFIIKDLDVFWGGKSTKPLGRTLKWFIRKGELNLGNMTLWFRTWPLGSNPGSTIDKLSVFERV